MAVHRFPPFIGGSERVASEIVQALMEAGHSVTVATEAHPARPHTGPGAIRTLELQARRGRLTPRDRERFREVFADGWDARIIYAAQSWQLDAVADLVGVHRETIDILAPVGLSKLGLPGTDNYFRKLAQQFASFDCLIFHSTCYQDFRFARLWTSEGERPQFAVIPNAADLRPAPSEAKCFDVATVSSHLRSKGHRHVRRLASRNDWSVAIVAPAAPALARRGCEWACRSHAVCVSGLHLIDGAARDAAVSTLAQARCFYLPSAVECSPLVIFEAMSLGVPWVSLDVGNVAELPGGVVVDSLDEADVAIKSILSDDEHAASLAELGRTAIAERYNWPLVRSMYSRLLEDLS